MVSMASSIVADSFFKNSLCRSILSSFEKSGRPFLASLMACFTIFTLSIISAGVALLVVRNRHHMYYLRLQIRGVKSEDTNWPSTCGDRPGRT